MPFVLIAVGWFGWKYYKEYRYHAALQAQTENALVTAQLLVAAAKYRHEPTRYEIYRDSILHVHDLTLNELEQYLKRYERSSDDPTPFTKRVNLCVDSLIALERGGVPSHPDTSGCQ